MSNIVPRGSSDISLPQRGTERRPSKRARDTSRELEAIYQDGIIDVAKADVAAQMAIKHNEVVEMVARHGMQAMDSLLRDEAALTRSDPLQADRYNGFISDAELLMRLNLRNLPRSW